MCPTVELKALCKVELKAMLNGTVEIISGRERRRRWGLEEKLRIVAETQEAGPRVKWQSGTTYTRASAQLAATGRGGSACRDTTC